MGIIAVDLGGTWMRSAVVSQEGECGAINRRPTDRERPAQEILADLRELIKECGDGEGVALGIAGVWDEAGRLLPCDNFPTLAGVNVAAFVEDSVDVPLAATNDARCFALGEWWRGAGRRSRCLCGVTLGTGFGCALVIDGRVLEGGHGQAGEIWASPFDEGTIEDAVSGRGIERAYEKRAGRTRSAKDIAALAARGDTVACEVFAGLAEALGRVVGGIVNLVDPDHVVIGGSLAKSSDLFLETAQDSLNRHMTYPTYVPFTPSVLGDTASLIGATRYFLDKNKERKAQ